MVLVLLSALVKRFRVSRIGFFFVLSNIQLFKMFYTQIFLKEDYKCSRQGKIKHYEKSKKNINRLKLRNFRLCTMYLIWHRNNDNNVIFLFVLFIANVMFCQPYPKSGKRTSIPQGPGRRPVKSLLTINRFSHTNFILDMCLFRKIYRRNLFIIFIRKLGIL